MPRADLLALSLDDLAALTNRGTVKRAQREIESGETTCKLNETDAGEVTAEWSDEARCIFPAGKTVSDARCSCPATTLCRHVVRSILAYQQYAAAGVEGPPPVAQPWDPGGISDDDLARNFKPQILASAKSRFAQGILAELVRSAKPTARFHQLACTLRFIVPNDLRYTHCDCAEPAPCSHVPLAIWAFRRLPADKSAGIVSTQDSAPPAPVEVLDQAEALLLELTADGMANLPAAWKDRIVRLERRMEEAGLIWPAQIASELTEQYQRYLAHDARFAPERVAELAGELLIRSDAIRSATPAVSQLLVRGSSADRTTDVGSARYIGLGCGVRQGRAGVEISAYLQDADSGSIVAISRDFADPPKDSIDAPRDYWQLAQAPVVRSIPLASLGSGQLLIQGGKRSPDHRLIAGRAKAAMNPQGYAWEMLRAPLLAEDFQEVRARLSALPPASLRPRYVAEDLHVLPIAAVAAAHFDHATQAIEITALDAREEPARIHHPFFARAAEGDEALLAALADESRKLRFVAGQASLTSSGLLIRPTMLVFDGGTTRLGIQPWVDRRSADRSGALPTTQATVGRTDSVTDFPQDLLAALGEVLLLGLRRADAQAARQWQELAVHAESLGYDRLARPIASLAAELHQKLANPRWNPPAAGRVALELALLAKLAQDVAG